MLRAPRRGQRVQGEGLVRAAADVLSLPRTRGAQLPEAAGADRTPRPEPPSRGLPQLCQEDLQEEQVIVEDHV